MIWFSADYHFGHYTNTERGIIQYCNRPFPNVDVMNEVIIERHNEIVRPDDFVFFLGDLTFQKNTDELLDRMNGKFTFIRGNHDKNIRKLPMLMDATIRLKGGKIVHMTHRPENTDTKADILLCGHVHEKWKVRPMKGYNGSSKLLINVGVDVWNFYPVSVDRVVSMSKGNGHYHEEEICYGV